MILSSQFFDRRVSTIKNAHELGSDGTLYLKDLTFFGCTKQPKEVFRNLINYIEQNKIRPLVTKTYPLKDIKVAQEDFLSKKFIGKLVLIPPDAIV